MKESVIIHFSQDFQEGKSQLGGYSRIYNLCSDGNMHYIFTIDKRKHEIFQRQLNSKIIVISIPVFSESFTRLEQIFIFKRIAQRIYVWLKNNNVKPDIFFGHSHLINYFILKQLKKSYNQTPLIWELNVIWGIHDVEGFNQKLINKLILRIQANIIKKSDAVIAQTNYSKEFVINSFDAKPEKIFVVENAILEKDIFYKSKLSQNKKYSFLCYGLFDKMNGIPFLIETIINNGEKENVFFYGKGAYESMVKNASDKELIIYKGLLEREDMIPTLRKFDFVIIPRLPKLEADLFIPTKLIECMANGLVPICSNVGGMKCVIEDGVDGILFEAGNDKSLLEAINKAKALDIDKLNIMSENAIKKIRDNYLWSNQHIKINLLYKKLINNNDRN
jgi:glycosyltransferase involved in cell wall biosynthesis